LSCHAAHGQALLQVGYFYNVKPGTAACFF